MNTERNIKVINDAIKDGDYDGARMDAIKRILNSPMPTLKVHNWSDWTEEDLIKMARLEQCHGK